MTLPHIMTAPDGALYPCTCDIGHDHDMHILTPEEVAERIIAQGEWGVRWRDGSVSHPWNGRTQRQRAEEFLAKIKVEYPGDASTYRLVWRMNRDSEWQVLE
jgi:hypothetical protein